MEPKAKPVEPAIKPRKGLLGRLDACREKQHKVVRMKGEATRAVERQYDLRLRDLFATERWLLEQIQEERKKGLK